MRKAVPLLAMLSLTGCFYTAPEPMVRATSAPSGLEVSSLITGRTLTLNDGARITYGANGRFIYRAGREQSSGTYRVNGDEVCTTYRNGNRRCDRYIGSPQGIYYLVNEQGTRFQVVSIS
jgi:hypothetical protein